MDLSPDVASEFDSLLEQMMSIEDELVCDPAAATDAADVAATDTADVAATDAEDVAATDTADVAATDAADVTATDAADVAAAAAAPPTAPADPADAGSSGAGAGAGAGAVRTPIQAEHDTKFLTAIMDLGPPPMVRRKQRGRLNESSSISQASSSSEAAVAAAAVAARGDEASVAMEAARFFYRGSPNKDGLPVYYLIMCQLKTQFMVDVDGLASFVRNTMQSDIDAPYALVIDMSWVRVTFEMKRLMYKQLSTFASIFNRQQKKNNRAIYLIHPSSFTSTVLYFASRFTSAKLRKKIHEIYEWEALHEFISPSAVALPESSKGYITKSYQVVKINSKGKEQDRLIKFTHNSILNIEPKTRQIRNERLLTEMQDITAPRSEPTIFLQFNENVSGGSSSSSFLSKFRHNDADSEFRKYRASSIDERNDIIYDIFERGFSAPAFPHDNQFEVVKQKGSGRKHNRTLKLTIDSVLTVAKGRIKKEVSFAGIESIHIDPTNESLVWLKYKGEAIPSKLFTDNARVMIAAFEHCIQASVAEDDKLAQNEKDDLNQLVDHEA